MAIMFNLLPMLIAISLVYGATRYEAPAAIAATVTRTFFQIVVAFGVILVALFVLSYRL